MSIFKKYEAYCNIPFFKQFNEKTIEFKNNNRIYVSFELPKTLNIKELTFIKRKINKKVFHLEIDNGNNTKSTIEIHLKNPLEKDLTLEKESKNNV